MDAYDIPTYNKAAHMIESILKTLVQGEKLHRTPLIQAAAKSTNQTFEKADQLAGRCITYCARKGYISNVSRGWFKVQPAGLKLLGGYRHRYMAADFQAFVTTRNPETNPRPKSKRLNGVVDTGASVSVSDIELVYWDFKTLDGWVKGTNGSSKESQAVSVLKEHVKTQAKDMNARQKERFVIRLRELVAKHNCARLRTFRHMMQTRYEEDDKTAYEKVLREIDQIARETKGVAQNEVEEQLKAAMDEIDAAKAEYASRLAEAESKIEAAKRAAGQ